MGFFKALVSTGINIITTPVAVVRDVVSLGGAIDNRGKSHTLEHLEKIKEEADGE